MSSAAAPSRGLPLRRDLGLADLVWLNIVIVLGVQAIAMAAHIGPLAVVLHVISALCFFVPMVHVVASLSKRFPGESVFTPGFGSPLGCCLRFCADGRGGAASCFSFPSCCCRPLP